MGKAKYLVVTGYFFCQFLDLFCDCSSCPLLFFRGARHLQYLQNNFSPGESPEKKQQLGSLLEVFPTLRLPPYFFHIPFISSKKFSGKHRQARNGFWKGQATCRKYRLLQDVLRCFKLPKIIPKPNYSGVS